MGLLGYTLGKIAGKSLQKLIQDEFVTYGMHHSYTNYKAAGKALVKGRDADGNLTHNWNFGILFGAGGIVSSTADLAKFARAQFNSKNQILAFTRKPTFTVNKQLQIGLGWHIRRGKEGQNLYWHNGGTGGYTAFMVVDTQHKIGVIVLSNVSAFSPQHKNIGKLTFSLLKETEK